MAVVNFTEEFTSTVAAPRLFKALILDNLIPKLAPESVNKDELIEGDGCPGSIKQINIGKGNLKYRVDELDEENLTYAYTVFGGDHGLMDQIEMASIVVKFESSPDGGCKGNNICTYVMKSGVEIKEEEIRAGKEKSAGLFKLVEDYLLANPEAYA